MEIRLNKPHGFLDCVVDTAAVQAKCHVRIKWWMPYGARFTLHASNVDATPASFEQHDATIHNLLQQYPDARIRTARATYESLADFEAQRKARVS